VLCVPDPGISSVFVMLLPSASSGSDECSGDVNTTNATSVARIISARIAITYAQELAKNVDINTSGMLRCVALLRTDVSEELSTSIIRVRSCVGC
jgi:hypothetical protein